jgi:hypothetical protein
MLRGSRRRRRHRPLRLGVRVLRLVVLLRFIALSMRALRLLLCGCFPFA